VHALAAHMPPSHRHEQHSLAPEQTTPFGLQPLASPSQTPLVQEAEQQSLEVVQLAPAL
jgi:hypothetical protein